MYTTQDIQPDWMSDILLSDLKCEEVQSIVHGQVNYWKVREISTGGVGAGALHFQYTGAIRSGIRFVSIFSFSRYMILHKMIR